MEKSVEQKPMLQSEPKDAFQLNRAVVTGATGMIGMALIETLLLEGCTIYALVRKGSPKLRALTNRFPQVILIECSLSDMDKPHKWRQHGTLKIDAFFHLGWDSTFGDSRNDMYIQTQNIKYTLDAVSLAQDLGCQVFVGAGSQAEYGPANEDLSSKTPVFPNNGYGMAKLCAGQMSRVMCGQKEIRHIWCRILSIYGPYDNPGTMIMNGIRNFLEGKDNAYTQGEQIWDYLYVSDCANALILAARYGRDGAAYPIGSGKARPLSEYIQILRNLCNPEAETGLGKIPYVPGQVMHLKADISELTNDTGFFPKVSFEEGIRSTITWCKEGMAYEDN